MNAEPETEADCELPASFGQERLWLLDRAGAGPAYNVCGAVLIHGELRPSLVSAALQAVAERHEVLRTTFEFGLDGGLRQIIHPRMAIPLEELDVRACADPLGEADAAVLRCVNSPFDLAAGPLLRALVIATGEREWILALAIHHIAADGWSIGILISELAACYAGQGATDLPAMTLQYGDWAAWQREQQPSWERAASYWTATLAGAEPVDLPVRAGRTAIAGSPAATIGVEIAADVAARLAALARSEHATPFMVTTAALALALSRWCGQQEVIVATPVAGRDRAEIEPLIGFFVNTLPLRIAVRHDDTFRTLLRRVRGVCLDAYAHQDLPFEMIMRAAGTERTGAAAPLTRVLLAVQDLPAVPWDVPGLTAEPYEVPMAHATGELTVALFKGEDGALRGHAIFAADLWEPADAAGLINCLRQVLRGAAAAADSPVATLTRPDEPERARLARLSQADADPPEPAFLHELVEAATAAAPGKTAVIDEHQALTYRQLDAAADGYARALRERGAGPDDIVALFLPRSARLVAAILGVLKSGAAYLPLDPAQPAELIDQLLADARPKLVLTARDLQDAPALRRARAGQATMVIAEDATSGQGEPVRAHPDGLALVLYTSGTTGTPKGVLITHRALASRVCTMHRLCPIGPGEAALVQGPVSFDMFTDQWARPLVAGGQAVIARPGGERDPGYLAGLVSEHGIVGAILVPSALHALLASPAGQARTAALRQVECGGEELPQQLAQRVLDTLPGVRLRNGYGPTEATLSVSFHDVTAADLRRRRIPIGRPMPGSSLHVLDEDLDPLPPGVAGELYIGGVQLARGYLRRPAITAAAFVPDPFHPGQRLYRTGDRGRWLPDGTLEFLGRRDGQVKLRGNRIELGTIEAVLESHPLVGRAAAAVTGDQLTDRRLVAYLCCPGGQPGIAELQSFLRARLPSAMVPQEFAVVPELPANRHGKLDRAALARLGGTALAPATAPVPPRTPAEQVLCDIWCRVLERADVGVRDDFYELGGNSMRAVTVFELAQDDGLLLPIEMLLGNHTVEELVQAIEENPQLGVDQAQRFAASR